MSIRCKHCARSTASSASIARHLGWRMFSGVSLTGKPLEDVVCPWCAGTAPESELVPTWRVRCRTCDWEYDHEDGEGPLDAKAAKQLARDHQCEPWIEIGPPNDDRWLPERSVNNDGSLVDDPRMRKVPS